MNISHLFQGYIYHKRFSPKTHEFSHKYSLFQINLNKNKLRGNILFSFNSFNVFSIYENEFLYPGNETLWIKANHLLRQNNYKEAHKIILLTNPKFFSATFNPISFFLCYDQESEYPEVIIAEVHNTFKEKHLYFLSNPKDCETNLSFTHQKEFHVSPFFNKQGNYKFKFKINSDDFFCKIDYWVEDKLMLTASFNGIKQGLSKMSLLKIALVSGYHIASPMLRILYQAFNLHFLKKIPIQAKPNLSHKNSFNYKKANFFQKLNMFFVFNWLKKLDNGKLKLVLPDGTRKTFGKTGQDNVNIEILNYEFFTDIAWQADLGFAKAYLKNFCQVNNLKSLFKIFVKNSKNIHQQSSFYSFLGHIIAYLSHLRNKNNLKNSKNNIQAHYDLGNDFFSLFLDSSKLYSSGYFPLKASSLSEAQQIKTKKLIDLLDIKANDAHILEIGSGWGYIACELAKKYGCKVTTITLSQEQKKYVEEKVVSENLQDLVTVKIKDYRLLKQKYDGIISVEMIEAVGKEYINDYFKICSNCLKENAKFVLQAITIESSYYSNYSKNKDFIQEFIFPGGHLFTKEILNSVSAKYKLKEIHSESIGKHYAKTLNCWESNFLNKLPEIKALGFDERFIKTWLYYFNYCEIGFQDGYIDTYQISYQKQ